MLRFEDAQDRLEKLQIKNWEDRRAAAMSRLPARLAALGLALFGRDSHNRPLRSWDARYQAQESARAWLAALSAGDRTKIFAVLFPRLADQMEAAWQLIACLPYEVDFERRGFRAPHDHAVHTQARSRWLENVIEELGGYDPDLPWLAAWAPYLSHGSGADSVGVLLAAALEAGGPEGEAIYDILHDSAIGQHPIGRMGRHVTRALLLASRPAGWELIEKLLLAAQRQEGLRQTILETVDEAHPVAFRRMLRLILEQNMVRFSSVVRAVDVWFGLQWTALTPGKVKEALQQVLHFLEDDRARRDALARASGETLYLALWTLGFEDAGTAVKKTAPLLKDGDVERRFVAVRFLRQLELASAWKALIPTLNDADLRVALSALDACPAEDESDLFKPLVRLYERLPAKQTLLPALVWPWAAVRADRGDIADRLVDHLGDRPATVLVPYVTSMGHSGKSWMINHLAKKKHWDASMRDLLFTLAGDRDSSIREHALQALKKCAVEEADAIRLESLLARKGSELRRGVLALLLRQRTEAALASSDRLLTAKKAEMRLGGLELLRLQVDRKKGVAAARAQAARFLQAHGRLDEQEQGQLDAILDVHRVVPTLDDALGLMNPAERSPRVAPRQRKVVLHTPAADACLEELDLLVQGHADTSIAIETWEGPQAEMLGNVEWGFPSPSWDQSLEENKKKLPLLKVWEAWWRSRPKRTRDRDGLELLRASYWIGVDSHDLDGWKSLGKRLAHLRPAIARLAGDFKPPKLKHRNIVEELVSWLLLLHPVKETTDFLLDAVETTLALVPEAELRRSLQARGDEDDWREQELFTKWLQRLQQHWNLTHKKWGREQKVRYWRLLHWRDEPVAGVARLRPDFDVVLAAYEEGAAGRADLIDHLLGPRDTETYWGSSFESLRQLTELLPDPVLRRHPQLRELVDRCRNRILEVELARGEMPTAATLPARSLGALTGLPTLVRLLQGLARKPFDRRLDYYASQSKLTVLSYLIVNAYPAKGDTPEVFTEQMKALIGKGQLTWERILELAFLAPQWARHIEHFFGWPGLAEGVCWLLAHTRTGRHTGTEVPQKDEEADVVWARLLRERTPMTQEQIDEGAVDVAWFARVYAAIGARRWQLLAAASKYGCSDNSHKKAILLGDVLRGKANRRELVSGVKMKRLKESVRMLGLLPLPDGAGREAELLARYKVLVEYRRYARGLSPMSREEAMRTAEVGLENLARTAGYPDPIRLEWAMEARAIADLTAGSVTATVQGVTVSLALSDQGEPQLGVQRGDQTLKSIPGEVRKHPRIAQLTERRADLKRQASRMRQSLEAAMIRGDAFTGKELRQLFEHPVLRPQLERLVLLGEGIRGYPVSGGKGLRDHRGKTEPIKQAEQLRIAHPHDLLAAGDWPQWQHDCFRVERVQPFKQLFRELYVLTAQEKKDRTASHRYTSHQINPGQALALFGGRGWQTQDEVVKAFYDLGLEAEVTFRSGAFSPLEMEGLTIEAVEFRRRGEWKPLPLTSVPPRAFSEVMRDVDLVVSVAHLGGVDPEASASTVDMRAALLRETCALLKVRNFQIKNTHVVIDGKLGKYTVHLGSAVVHRQPGGSLCIVPVHAQQRGRLFLPFADDDPRTAEVLSKVLLLARDEQIQDPGIQEQLRS